ncbi:mannose-1-phosphate guanylyltransferase [Neosynechococcus sphagnicola sy1]|uniref:Mannose-1-phosphate guanylyltransferase n=1 Tax=Neosynechococcus sphagnicola sy1 TaxID=1497020 RepID=A0A098TLP5_9CYAN|nr:mannose-1-phosphate guanylyltransferase [Neosynechococcus sphagnicola]KGF73229.1 mannose-1-phosphate guanylyltransferase [Neosynechococcus sphagnicola sy1]
MAYSLIPVILAGGKGERFWPLSRQHRPKQFLCLDGSGQTLLQATANRLLDLAGGWSGVWVITASHLAAAVQAQLPELPMAQMLVEPEGRDTAPAVAWATLEVTHHGGEDAVVGFFPADHWIGEPSQFQETLRDAASLAATQPVIVTLGIQPGYPATGYGYIEQGELLETQLPGRPAYRVQRFTEKPNRETAAGFLASGRFSWNSGIFIFRAGVALAELQAHAPEILEPLQRSGVAAYPQVPKTSIDYALMEKTQQACVVPVSFSWDDLGDWNALERLLPAHEGNIEQAQHWGLNTQGSILYNTDPDELIVTLGVENLVIVRDGNVTLIADKQQTQDIKQVLQQLRSHPQYRHLL